MFTLCFCLLEYTYLVLATLLNAILVVRCQFQNTCVSNVIYCITLFFSATQWPNYYLLYMYNLRDIFPFSSVSNEDLYSVFQTHCQTSDNPQNNDSEELFANTINENSENFSLEIYDDSDLSIPLGSQYYTENMIVTKTQSRSINNFCILHMNIRSMNKNFEKLKIFLDKAQCERAIIGITETWFSGSPHSMYSHSGYNMITNSRQKKREGGVHCSFVYSYTL